MSIKDVARVAGVSTASVSRVLTGSPGVGEKTAKRIRSVMEELGYKPNLGARGLVKRQTGNIAIVFSRGSSFILGNPFFSRVLEGIAKVLDQLEYNSLLSFTSQQQQRLLETQAVDGIILFAPRSGELSLDWLKMTSLPLVVIGSYADESPLPCVRPDDEGGISLAVRALYDLGHRDIGLVNGPASSMKSQKCRLGYTRTMRELGLPYRPERIYEVSEFDAAKAADAMARPLGAEREVTGLVCAADYMAMGVVKAAAANGLAVPRDLSVVGFGDVPFAEFFIPSLSTVHTDLLGIGRQATSILIDMIRGKQIRKKERVFPMEYVARMTTAPPASRSLSDGVM
ncbi:LacI family DNA-binding transcriptional regulator [Paenibacillus sp. GYB004]|uniref:LacI family DNA-binding transcriptional regulator n=1 Tax=Paenibacillus sp. GYB004 TaxID=2994393 RepID=UPI002F96AD22